ncbi:hypothetical protein XU18_1053 [Perkinsela sp. CCAP 1560/4]|nr:hypothetical protein XU18_1053 [Perkinsela sp. CCAP 1560/4]|eukprot:KNH08484.1 hypothetical protein XU18_1053 [Perkinsela sp. CCAP 1560/4]
MFRLQTVTRNRVTGVSAASKVAESCKVSHKKQTQSKSNVTQDDSFKRLDTKMSEIQKTVEKIFRSLAQDSLTPEKCSSSRSLRRQLDASERKIVREELYSSIVNNPGISLDAHAQKMGISPLLAKKCFGSLNCMRMIKPAKDIAL